nr:RecName: Full=Angiotensin-like peptide 1 [Bothrops jararaca]
DRVYVHPFYL